MCPSACWGWPVWRPELRKAPSLAQMDPGLRAGSAFRGGLLTWFTQPVHSTSESVSSSAWDDAGPQLLEK